MSPDSKLPYIAEAGVWYRHAEVIVQQRLNNFLVVATILLATIATVLAATAPDKPSELAAIILTKYRTNFVVVLSVIGFLLSVAYGILGARQKKFVQLHKEVVMHLV